MFKRTLLLDSTFQVQSFISFKKTIKFLIKEKTEIISYWDESISYGNGEIKYPAILKLKNHVRRNHFDCSFSRRSLVKRDGCICQYCGKHLTGAMVTIDHVIPKAQGGKTSFVNCVVACQPCNGQKADRTPEQAGMVLLRKPQHPSIYSIKSSIERHNNEPWHEDWDNFLNH